MYARASPSQILTYYRAEVHNAEAVSAEHETSDFAWFSPKDIPWSTLAFPATRFALEHFIKHGTDDVIDRRVLHPPAKPSS